MNPTQKKKWAWLWARGTSITVEGCRQTAVSGLARGVVTVKSVTQHPESLTSRALLSIISHPALLEFDNLLQTVLEHITNCSFVQS